MTSILHEQVEEHFRNYRHKLFDKNTIPLYLFLSGAGTGKSRNATELHRSVRKCFDGTLFENNDILASCVHDPFVFHISFENGTSLGPTEKDPWRAIGTRMLYQLLRQHERAPRNITLSDVLRKWHAPTPSEVIRALSPGDFSVFEKKATFLIVDGLHTVSLLWDKSTMLRTLTTMGDLAHSHPGFMIVCGTSIASGPIDEYLISSRRRRIALPCKPLESPTIEHKPVFKVKDPVQEVLISDCGGHGRALELLDDIFPHLQGDIGPEVKYLIAKKLLKRYGGALPDENDGIAIIKAVLAHRYMRRNRYVPGTKITPDEVCQNGLIHFEMFNPDSWNSLGYFKIPYIWLLVLCITSRKNDFLGQLQLLDYRDFQVKDQSTVSGGFSWSDFESLMVKFRKIKSHVFDDGESVTIEDVHQGAFMHPTTKSTRFSNRHLTDDVAIHQIPTKTSPSLECSWVIKTRNSGEINIRDHKYIVLNAAGAPAGDAVLSLDSSIPRTESQQCKNLQKGFPDLDREREKAASPEDVFTLFCTGSIPRLRDDDAYTVPPGNVLVAMDNWGDYFGPYAGRFYVYARVIRESQSKGKKRKHSEIEV